MNTFTFKEDPVPFIRREMFDRPEDEVRSAERRFYQYLDLSLRIFEAENGSVIAPNSSEA